MDSAPNARDDRGDTFIELLVALVVISLAVVGLIGGLLTSTAASVTHRNLASLDNVLRSVAASIQSAVSGQPGSDPGAPLLYQACLKSTTDSPYQPYQVAGPLYPSIQAVHEPVSIPAIGLAPNTPITVKVGGIQVPAGTSSASGAVIATFDVPAGLAGSQTVQLLDGSSTVAAPNLNVSSANTDALLGNYALNTSLAYWNGSTFLVPSATSCSNIQKLTLTLSKTDRGSGGSDTADVLLQATNDLAVPTESVASSTTSPKPLGTNFSFTATVSGAPTTPTGNVMWSFPGAPAGTACTGPNPSSLGGGTTSCGVKNTTEGVGCTIPAVGSYTAVAAYGGDPNWTGTSSETTSTGSADTMVISQGTATVATSSPSPNPAAIGSTISFKATVTGSSCIVPSGSVTWSFPAGTPAGAACAGGDTTNLAADGTATCSISPALPGTYKPLATYGGDTNYVGGANGNQASITVSVPAGSTTSVSGSPNNPGTGSSLTFTATVIGVPGLTPTGTVTWSFSPASPAGATCSNLTGNSGALNGSGQATCTVSNAQPGTYTATATYGGSSNYSGSSGSASLAVSGKATPTVSVSGSVSNGAAKQLTFTATIQPPGATAAPQGTVNWTISASDNSNVSCSTNPTTVMPGSGNAGTSTCTISGSTSSSVTYTATANYSGDSNYAAASGSGSHKG